MGSQNTSSSLLSWMPSYLNNGLTATQNWYQEMKETVWDAMSETEESFFMTLHKDVDYMEFKGWRRSIKNEIKALNQAILSGEMNAVELGQRLLAFQTPKQMKEEAYSPVMYAWALTQLEKSFRKKARKNKATNVTSEELILSADTIHHVLKQLRRELYENTELADENFDRDFYNAVLMYVGDNPLKKGLSKEGLLTILDYYKNLIDDSLHESFVNYINTLPEYFDDYHYSSSVSRTNREIKSLLQNIQDIFEDYESQAEIKTEVETELDTNQASRFQRFGVLLETAFELTEDVAQQGIQYVRENPTTVVKATVIAAAALSYGYSFSVKDNSSNSLSDNIFKFHENFSYSSWDNFVPDVFQMSQASQIFFDVSAICGLSILSGHQELGAPGAFITSFARLWDGAQSAAPTVVNPISDQTANIGKHFSHVFRWNEVFNDADGDTLAVSATLSDGSPLPDWLHLKMFDYSYLLGHYNTPEYAQAVQIVGNIAYVADGNSGLQILDISNPAAPFRLSFYDTPGVAMGICVDGTTAYVADGDAGIVILDVSNPSAPFKLGSFDPNDTSYHNAHDISISGTVAYVAHGRAGLLMLDVSNPAIPSLLGSYVGGEARAVSISGSTAYVAGWSSGLLVIDVSNPAAPFLLGSYDTPGLARDISISGSTVYLACESAGILAVDVSNPAAPFLLGSYDTLGSAKGLYISGDIAYVADDKFGLQVLNISNPTASTWLGGYDTPHYAYDVSISGSVACVSDAGSGIQLIDISTHPFAHHPLGVAETLLGAYGTGYAYDVSISGSTAYIAENNFGLHTVDISNPAAPYQLGSYVYPGGFRMVTLSDNRAYVFDTGSEFHILDVTNLVFPNRLGGYTTLLNSIKDMSVSNNIACVIGSAGLEMVNVSNPASPFWLGSYDTGYSYAVSVVDNVAYVGSSGALYTLDVSDPSAPALLGNWYSSSSLRDVSIVGNIAYVVDWDFLHILDVSNPAAPYQLSRFDGGVTSKISVSGGTACLTGYGVGLQFVDVSNSAAPYQLGIYDVDGFSAGSVSISGSTVYVLSSTASGFSGLSIIDIARRNFYGTPTELGNYTINVTASDQLGGSVSDQFQIVVGDMTTSSSLSSTSSNRPSSTSNPVPSTSSNRPSSTSNPVPSTSSNRPSSTSNPILSTSSNRPSSTSNPILSTSSNRPSSTSNPISSTSSNRPSSTSNPIQSTSSNRPSSTFMLSTLFSSASNSRTSSSFLSATDLTGATSLTDPSISQANSESSLWLTISEETLSDSQSRDPENLRLFFELFLIGLICAGASCAVPLIIAARYFYKKSQEEPSDIELSEIEEGYHNPYVTRYVNISMNGCNESDQQVPPASDSLRRNDSFYVQQVELTPRMLNRKPIGQYYEMTNITREEAGEIFRQTGRQVPFKQGKNKANYLLGRGNFSKITIAFNKENGTYVALKKVEGIENMQASLNEAEIQRKSAKNSEHILPIYNTHKTEKVLYHFLPLAGLGDGLKIQERMKACSPAKKEEIITWIAHDCLAGLSAIHSKHIYNLDVKPKNILFARENKVYISDFGCAQVLSNGQVGRVIGDENYFSPERLNLRSGTIQADKVDAWALGVSLLEIAIGRYPFEKVSSEKLHANRDEHFFERQIEKIDEFYAPEENSIMWIIKGLLDTDSATRLSVKEALLQTELLLESQNSDQNPRVKEKEGKEEKVEIASNFDSDSPFSTRHFYKAPSSQSSSDSEDTPAPPRNSFH